MTKLPKFTLTHNEKRDRWDLTSDSSGRTVATFETKGAATKGGALQGVIGKAGGSVKIQKVNGRFQEERTYPGAADPKKSPG